MNYIEDNVVTDRKVDPQDEKQDEESGLENALGFHLYKISDWSVKCKICY